MQFDIEVTGQGFYSIFASTPRGEKWMQQVEGFDGQVAYTDTTGYAMDISDGAIADGLKVSVNGHWYLGNNRVA